MFYCLDRIEDGDIAVLTDENGIIINVELACISGVKCIGAYYTFENGKYIYNEKQTTDATATAQNLLSELRKKAKKQ